MKEENYRKLQMWNYVTTKENENDCMIVIGINEENGTIELDKKLLDKEHLSKINDVKKIRIDIDTIHSPLIRPLFKFKNKNGQSLDNTISGIKNSGTGYRTIFDNEHPEEERIVGLNDESPQIILFNGIELKGFKDVLESGKSFWLNALQNYLNENENVKVVDIPSILHLINA